MMDVPVDMCSPQSQKVLSPVPTPANSLSYTPTAQEIAVSASSAYVQSLQDTIQANEVHVKNMLTQIDTLTHQRETYMRTLSEQMRQQERMLHELRADNAQLQLQVQEEQERSTRLLHENTILLTQEAEQSERLAALVSLCQARGKKKAGALRSSGSVLTICRRHQDTVREGHSISTVPPSVSIRHAVVRRDLDTKAGIVSEVLESATNKGNEVDDDDSELHAALLPSRAATAAHIVALTKEVHMLRQQLDEQRLVYERERAKRVQEEREQHCKQAEANRAFTVTIEHLQELHECSMRDLISYRHRVSIEQRDLMGQVDWLKRSLHEALLHADNRSARRKDSVSVVEHRVAQKYKPLVGQLQSELSKHRRLKEGETKKYEAMLEEKSHQIEGLQHTLMRERTNRRRSEERHQLELQGVKSELDLMRQSLRQLEKKLYFQRAREMAAVEEEEQRWAEFVY